MASNIKNKSMIIFIGVLVISLIGIALITATADQEVLITSTITVRNTTVTGPAVNASLELLGRELITAIRVNNRSNNSQIVNGGILETTRAASDGLLTVSLRFNDTASSFAGQQVNVSYIAEPDGFVEGAPRSILGTVVLLAVIGLLLAVVIALLFKSEMMQRIKNLGG